VDNFYIDKVLQGDKHAFRYFVKEYKNHAYNLAISIVKDADNAEDVVQSSFIKAYKSLRSFKRDAKFSSWLYRIVVNEAYMFLRKNKINFAEIDDRISQLAFEEPKENEQLELAKKMMLSLNPNEALVLNLFYLEENKRNSIYYGVVYI
jgi:RNA polymerase sigma-70 factor (ECF subfamily)